MHILRCFKCKWGNFRRSKRPAKFPLVLFCQPFLKYNVNTLGSDYLVFSYLLLHEQRYIILQWSNINPPPTRHSLEGGFKVPADEPIFPRDISPSVLPKDWLLLAASLFPLSHACSVFVFTRTFDVWKTIYELPEDLEGRKKDRK